MAQSRRCTEVIDGDTFEVNPKWRFRGRTGNRVRIANLNAPERGTYGAKTATRKLTKAVLAKDVELEGRSFSYGRLVADVKVNGKDVVRIVKAMK